MKLHVMRHGPAEDEARTGRDADRALTRSGKERVHRVAETLVARGEAPAVIVSSPLVRARETAEIVAEVVGLGAGSVTLDRLLAPGGDEVALFARQLEAGLDRVLVVGHEPALSDVVLALVGTLPPTGMEKAMVVGLELTALASGQRGRFHSRLRFVLEPKTLRFDVAG